MNNKILIGSIISICILVGVSFTSVVGYRSVESGVKASPLFNIRSNRRMNRNSGNLHREYIGQGEPTFIDIPNRDNEKEKIWQIIDRIQLMDDETFNKFINLIFYRIQKNNGFKELNINDVIHAFNKLRNYKEATFSNNTNMNEIYTVRFKFIPTICWFPGCIALALILSIPILIIDFITGVLGFIWLMFFYRPDTMTAC